MIRLLAAITSLVLVVLAGVARAEDVAAHSLSHRPFRAGVLRLNPNIDGQKPLASSDGSGWLLANDHLIGVFDDHWVGAYSPQNHDFSWWFLFKEKL